MARTNAHPNISVSVYRQARCEKDSRTVILARSWTEIYKSTESLGGIYLRQAVRACGRNDEHSSESTCSIEPNRQA